MKKLNLALVGYGRYGSEWMGAAHQFADVAEFIAVVDIDYPRALACQEKYGTKYAYASVDEALENKEIEAFVLALPHHVHHDIAIQCMKARKHVLVEKIMSLSFQESLDMVRVADEMEVKLMSSQTQRFADGHRKIHDMAVAGELGEVYNITGLFRSCLRLATPWWAEDKYVGEGFIVPMKGSHTVDMMTWWKGGEIPVRVYAQCRHINPSWEGYDECTYTLTYENGSTAVQYMTFCTDRWQNDQCIYMINGSKGFAQSDLWGRRTDINTEIAMHDRNSPEFIEFTLREFASAIAEDRDPIASGREVAPVNAILEAIVLSAKTNQPVDMKEKYPELFAK